MSNETAKKVRRTVHGRIKMVSEEVAEDIDRARRIWPRGSHVSCIIVHHSGMRRVVVVLDIQRITHHDRTQDEVANLSWLVARLTGYIFDRKHGGVQVGGCGFSATNSVVNDLSSFLWGDGSLRDRDIC